MDRCIENVIEFLENQESATVTFSQGRYKGKIRKLAEERPGECQIIAENKDGSLCAHIPVKWIRIIPCMKLSEEQREQRRLSIQKAREIQNEKGKIGLKTV